MKTNRLIIILTGFWLFFALIPNRMQGQYTISPHILGGGATIVQNVQYKISATVSQTLIGVKQNTSTRLHAGFWYPIARTLVYIPETVEEISVSYSLGQNFPNPFNPSTTISYAIPQRSHIILKIFNSLGKEMATLVDEQKDAGHYKIEWKPDLPSGVYFYRLQAGGFVETKKLILLK